MKTSVRYIQTEQNIIEKDENNKKAKISKIKMILLKMKKM